MWQSNGFSPPGHLALTGTGGVAQPSRPGPAPKARAPRVFLATPIEEAPHAASGGAGAAPPAITTTPANQRLTLPSTHALGQAGEQYGPSTAPFGRARCLFSPRSRPYIYIPQAGQRAGPTWADFRVSDLAVVLQQQHSYWTYLTGFGRWIGSWEGLCA